MTRETQAGARVRVERALDRLKAANAELQAAADELCHVTHLGTEVEVVNLMIQRVGIYRERLFLKKGDARLRAAEVR